jgi:hypothetical protein
MHSDPGEHQDLALSQPTLAQDILDRMKKVQWFNPERGDPHPVACEVAERTGFWGPFLDDSTGTEGGTATSQPGYK